MLRKKQIKDLPIGFTPVPTTGRGSRYNSSKQKNKKNFSQQEIKENPAKGQSRVIVVHRNFHKATRGMANCKWKNKEQLVKDAEKNNEEAKDQKDN